MAEKNRIEKKSPPPCQSIDSFWLSTNWGSNHSDHCAILPETTIVSKWNWNSIIRRWQFASNCSISSFDTRSPFYPFVVVCAKIFSQRMWTKGKSSQDYVGLDFMFSCPNCEPPLARCVHCVSIEWKKTRIVLINSVGSVLVERRTKQNTTTKLY